MRAKMIVTQVTRQEHQDDLRFTAVAAGDYSEDGSDENNTFARYTPCADLEMTIANPDLLGSIELGQEYYLDFSLAS